MLIHHGKDKNNNNNNNNNKTTIKQTNKQKHGGKSAYWIWPVSSAQCVFFSSFFFFFKVLLCSLRETIFRSSYLGKAQQPQAQRYPFLSMCVIFSCLQTVVWLSVFGICKVRTELDVCDCTPEMYGHRKRVCTESRLWEKNALSHRGLEPASVLRLAFESDALPPELSGPLAIVQCRRVSCRPKSESGGRIIVPKLHWRLFHKIYFLSPPPPPAPTPPLLLTQRERKKNQKKSKPCLHLSFALGCELVQFHFYQFLHISGPASLAWAVKLANVISLLMSAFFFSSSSFYR